MSSQSQPAAALPIKAVPLPPSKRVLWHIEGECYLAPEPISNGMLIYRKVGNVFTLFASVDQRGMLLIHEVEADIRVKGFKIDPQTGRVVEETLPKPPEETS